MDLISKEFKYHDKCYKTLTKKIPSAQESKSRVKKEGNFEAEVPYIEDKIIAHLKPFQ